jgi:hypothetical protein
MCGLAGFTRSTAPSNGMDAQRATGVLLSSPAAAQRCAKGAGLDSSTAVVAQFAMPSIALPCSAPTTDDVSPTPAAPVAPQLEPRISTSLTDVTTNPAPTNLLSANLTVPTGAVATLGWPQPPPMKRWLCAFCSRIW